LGDTGALREGYEWLRAAVLAGSASGWRLGHGVLSARGMTGWMRAFGELAPPAPGGPTAAVTPLFTPESPKSPAGRPVSLPQAEVVAVLAQMTLAIAA